MNIEKQQQQQMFYAKMAGLSYIIFTLAGFINSFYLNSALSSVELVKANGIFANEMHFRWGIIAETVMFLGVVTASVSFYSVLKYVHKPLAQTALCCRLVEIIIGGMAVVFSIAMLALSNKAFLTELFDAEQIRTLNAVIASLRFPAYEYSWIFMGVAGIITFYMFFTTRLIPRFWCVWGMITYSSLIIYPLAKILIPDLPREAMFVMFPGALFELGVGIWLLTKGIKFSH